MENNEMRSAACENDEAFRRAYAEEDLIHRVALRVLRLRQKRDLTQQELAALLGTKQPDIARLEGGYQNLTLRRVAQIAFILDCRPEDLVARDAPEILTSHKVRVIRLTLETLTGDGRGG